MDPATLSAGASVIGAVGSLFGGGGSKAEWVTPKYGEIRRKAEAAGFNPLTALSMAAGGVGTSTQSTFGQRVADAALGVSNAAASAQDYSLQKTALEQREREITIKEKAAEKLARQSRLSTGIGQRQLMTVGGKNPQTSNQTSMYQPLPQNTGTFLSEPITLADTQTPQTAEEIARLGVPKGGKATERSIYERELPFGFGSWWTKRPALGQRLEDDNGEAFGLLHMIPYQLEDIGRNLAGNEVNPLTGDWQPSEKQYDKAFEKMYRNYRSNLRRGEAALTREQWFSQSGLSRPSDFK